jgi:hypothetical protein
MLKREFTAGAKPFKCPAKIQLRSFKKTNHFCDAHHFPHGHGASSKPMGIFTSKAVVHPKLVTLQDGEIRGTDPGMDQDLYGCWDTCFDKEKGQ